MAQAKGIVASSMNEISRAVNVAKTALGALGVGLSVGYFASLIKGSIDAADHLNDLSKSTNIAIKDLAGLQLAAKQSGGDLDGIAQAVNKLSVNMGKDAEKYRLLGITAKDPLEAFKQLADIFVAIQDPQQRAAVMAEALGKSWASAAPLLAEGGQKIGEVVTKGGQLSGATKEMAEEADKFNDQMAELNTTLSSTTVKAIGPLLPGMNEIASAMREAAKEGGLLLTIWVALGGAMANLLGMTEGQKVQARLREIGDQLEVARKQLQAGTLNPAGASSHFFSFLVPDIKLGEEGLAKIRTTVDALEKERARLTPSEKAAPGGVNPAAASEAGRKAKEFLEAEARAAAAKAAAARAAAAAEKATKEAAKKALDEYNKSLDNTAKSEAALTKARQEGAAVEAAASLKRGEALIAGYAAAKQIEFETKLIGLSNTEREVAIALRELETKGIRETDDAYQGLAERMRSAISGKVAAEESKKASEAAAKEWESTFERRSDSLTRTISDGLMRGFEKGAKSGAEVVIDTLKNALRTTVFEPVINAIISPVSRAITGATMGMFGGNAAAGSAGAAGGMGGFGNILSGANSLFGGGFGNAAMDIGNALGIGVGYNAAAISGTAGIAELGLIADAATAAASAGAMGGAMAGIGAALPWVGGALAVGSMLGLFGGGSNALPEVPLGFQHPGVDQAKYASDPLYRQAAQQAEAAHRATFGVTWTQPNANGDGSPVEAVRQSIEALYQPLVEQLQVQQQLLAAQPQLEASLANAVRTLPQSLGISSLEAARMGLATSESVAPLDRFAAARGYLDENYGRAIGGDLSAVQAFPELLQSALGIGRDVFASGPQFAELFTSGNRMLNDLLARQNEIQAEMTASVPMTIKEAAADQITELKRGFKSMVDALAENNSRLRDIEQALAA